MVRPAFSPRPTVTTSLGATHDPERAVALGKIGRCGFEPDRQFLALNLERHADKVSGLAVLLLGNDGLHLALPRADGVLEAVHDDLRV